MNTLYGLAQLVAGRWGLNVTRAANTLECKRARILAKYDISIVLDVGANAGQFAQEVRGIGYRGRIVSFEPVTTAYDQLVEVASKDPHHECRQLALGDTDQTAIVHVSEGDASSSILEVEPISISASRSTRHVSDQEVQVARLDTIRDTLLRESDRAYLKLDVQGYEDRVLAGARETLRQVDGIEIELSLVPLYKGQAMLPVVWSRLTQSGFRPVWIERGFSDPVTGFMLQVDAIFVRE
jgi:FkbM family methyltransferase